MLWSPQQRANLNVGESVKYCEKVHLAMRLCGESAHDLGDDVQSDDTEDEDNGQGHDHNGVDLQTGRLISV